MLLHAAIALGLAAGPGQVSLHTIESGLQAPTSVTSAPNGTMFVTEKQGRIVKVRPGGKARNWFSIKVSAQGERGLLSMVRIDSKRFYAAYTDSAGALQVSRFTKGGGQRKIIRIAHGPYANHNGGQIALHKGLLYISTGDGGGTGDPYRAAEDLKDLRGKILRIDPTCAKKTWCVPASNPRSPSGAVIAYGLRNPWRFSIDPVTDQMWIGDVGQDAYEEVDRMKIDGPLVDFGWSCWEGLHPYRNDRCRGRDVTKPVIEYGHRLGESVTGGLVYRGSAIPSLRGWYIYGDFESGRIWAWRDGRRPVRVGTAPGLTAFGQTRSGEVLLTTIDGKLLKMRPKR